MARANFAQRVLIYLEGILVIVAASTECFSDLSLPDVYEKLVELEYTGVEVSIDEAGTQLKPSEVIITNKINT